MTASPMLAFRLPDFLRLSWVSDSARSTWEPRLLQLRALWPQVAVQIAAASPGMCAIRSVPAHSFFALQAFAAERGVAVVVLGARGVALPAHATDAAIALGRPFLYDLVLGDAASCAAVEQLWQAGDYAAAWARTGSPACCVRALAADVEAGRVDPLGRYVADAGPNTPAPETTFSDTLAVGALDLEQLADQALRADVFWSWAHLQVLDCAPCRLCCEPARALRRTWIAAAADGGFHQELAWLREIFSWPASWSELHGVAELKTPLLKVLWSSDASSSRRQLDLQGTGYPQEGATGLRFPYRSPARSRLTASAAFQRGLENLIQIQPHPNVA